MLYDCHVHTRHSGHSEDYSMQELKEEAVKKGIEISLREHAPFPKEFFDLSRKWHYEFSTGLPAEKASLNENTIVPFFCDVLETGLSLGFEVDILPGFEKETESTIKTLENIAKGCGISIDGINGSHHYFRGQAWDSSLELLTNAIQKAGGFHRFVQSYFGQIRDAMRTGFYDAISHLELPMRFIRTSLEDKFLQAKGVYIEELEKTFSAAKECNVAIEYNTSGIGRACRMPFLSGYSLHFAYHKGVPLVIGSDAHAITQLGGILTLALSS